MTSRNPTRRGWWRLSGPSKGSESETVPPELPKTSTRPAADWWLLALAAALFTAAVVEYSLQYGRLIFVVQPWEDCRYVGDGLLRLTEFYGGGFGEALWSYFRNPPASPYSTYLASAGYAVFGPRDWAPYAASGVLILLLLVYLDRRLSDLAGWKRGLVLGFALLTPMAFLAVHEYRPDLACGLFTALGILAATGAPLDQLGRWGATAAGAWFGLALLAKPSIFPGTLIFLAGALALSALRAVSGGPSSGRLRECVRPAAWITGLALLVSLVFRGWPAVPVAVPRERPVFPQAPLLDSSRRPKNTSGLLSGGAGRRPGVLPLSSGLRRGPALRCCRRLAAPGTQVPPGGRYRRRRSAAELPGAHSAAQQGHVRQCHVRLVAGAVLLPDPGRHAARRRSPAHPAERGHLPGRDAGPGGYGALLLGQVGQPRWALRAAHQPDSSADRRNAGRGSPRRAQPGVFSHRRPADRTRNVVSAPQAARRSSADFSDHPDSGGRPGALHQRYPPRRRGGGHRRGGQPPAGSLAQRAAAEPDPELLAGQSGLSPAGPASRRERQIVFRLRAGTTGPLTVRAGAEDRFPSFGRP